MDLGTFVLCLIMVGFILLGLFKDSKCSQLIEDDATEVKKPIKKVKRRRKRISKK